MKAYSPFFQTLHDEQAPTGYLGRGTHSSVLRAITFHDVNCQPLKAGTFLDFAVIWDEDHDTRVIEAVEQLYRLGCLGAFLAIGERKGMLNAIISDKITDSRVRQYLEGQVFAVAQGMDDPWSSSVGTLDTPGGIIQDDDANASLYLNNLNMLWRLGIRSTQMQTANSIQQHQATRLMRFSLGEVWQSASRRAVVVATDDDGRKGKLHFDDTGGEEWFGWHQLTQAGQWQVDTSPRPKRSAEELRAMILQRIGNHPVCPKGMDVVVTKGPKGGWEVASVPPKNSNIAYADCARHITQTAQVLRLLYDLGA